jgi:hypothetical protein
LEFKLNRDAILKHDRVEFVDDVVDIHAHLDDLEKYINICYAETGMMPIQSGRVVALRATDHNRLSSAFKSAVYLGKYNNMDNTERFLKKMVSAGHSYEPIRGESILFIYIGVGKPVYDHLITYSVGRTSRIAGGQRANVPWGYEVPSETKYDSSAKFMRLGLEKVREVVAISKGLNEDMHKQQLQTARSLLPVGYVMPPFLLEFSEEALIKNIFTQRIFERGAQGATVDVVRDMWNIVMDIDEKKWTHLYDYHGPHKASWEKAMRSLREKKVSVGDLIDMAQDKEILELSPEYSMYDLPLYDMIMGTVGKLPPSMWDKQ